MELKMEMDRFDDCQLCFEILHKLCVEIQERPVGSAGNLSATEYFGQVIAEWGWEIRSIEFPAVDWQSGPASLKLKSGREFMGSASPYSRGTVVKAPLVSASRIKDLTDQEISGKAVLLHGEIAREQIMPKHFPFYQPDHHRELIAVLERESPAFLITASGRNASSAGGLYPYPMFEDGDFLIPSVYVTAEEGEELLKYTGQVLDIHSESTCSPSFAFQVFASKGEIGQPRILITAHIDAKKNTPGALDNASGITVLLLIAKALEDYQGKYRLEIIPVNGEDYYAASGEKVLLQEYQGLLEEVVLNINIDGVGYYQGETGISSYGVKKEIEILIETLVRQYPGIKTGQAWYEGDHTLFIQQGIPAVAVTSTWFQENPEHQNITHTPADNLSVLSMERIVTTAHALSQLLTSL